MTDSSQPMAAPRTSPSAAWPAVVGSRPGSTLLAILSFGAAGIHFAVSPDHFAEWLPYGVAFACLAWFQLSWSAAYLVGATRRLRIAGVVVNTAVVAVWAWSRTIGLPIGPEPGATEAVGFADALSSGLEAVLVLGLLTAHTQVPTRLAAGLARQPARWAVALLAALVVLATVAAMAALAPQAMSMG